MNTELPQQGAKPQLEWLDIDRLIIDNNYQREIDIAHVRRILAKFQWRFFQAITVTRIDGGKYAVIDGQHRHSAATAHPSINKVPCLIVDSPSMAAQAEGFIVMNQSQKRITPVELYWAALTAGIPEYVQLAELLEDVGVQVHSHSSYGTLPAKTTAAVNTIKKQIFVHGEAHVKNTLKAILLAWPEQTGAFVTRVIEACVAVINQDGMTKEQVADGLRNWTPTTLVNKARILAEDQDIKITEAVSNLIKRGA